MINTGEKAKISQYFSKQPVELVYLFGSQADGKPTPLSDFDFAVLFVDNLSKKNRLKIDYEQVADNINNRLGDFEKFAQQIAKLYS